MTKNNNSEDLLHNQIATMNYLKRQNGELKKEVKGLKEHNHKLKHQYDLLQIRCCSLNDKYQRILVALNEVIERNSKAIEYIEQQYKYEETAKEDYDILLDILKGVDKE